jgi:hypothetical protein
MNNPFRDNADGNTVSNILRWGKYALILIPVLFIGWNSFKVVPRGYVATKSVFGVLDPQPLLAGFNIGQPAVRRSPCTTCW